MKYKKAPVSNGMKEQPLKERSEIFSIGPITLWMQIDSVVIYEFPIILCMGNFGNRASFRPPVFGGFTRFGVWRFQKYTKLA